MLNQHGLSINHVNRTKGRCGGLALISKSHYKVEPINSVKYPSFEHATWKVMVKDKPITITRIYHPPYSTRNKITNAMFLDDFTDLTTKLMPDHLNNVYIGDFNLHVSKEDDINAAFFNDSIEALGLYQHVTFPTHREGNVLDLVISEINSNINIQTTSQGPFLLDHCAIISTLSVKKYHQKTLPHNVCHLHKVTKDQWLEEFNTACIELTYNLSDMVNALNTELSRMLDTLAPTKVSKAPPRVKQPWYNHTMTDRKHKVQKLERKWKKYGPHSLWLAYKSCRNSYYSTLNSKKKDCIKHQIKECAKNSRKLHRMVNNLTTKSEPPAWPLHDDETQLAEEFALFFENKILAIRDLFKNIPPYNPKQHDIPKFTQFAPMSEKEVNLIIKSMKTKSCKLDTIPTDILKMLLPKIGPLMTKIVNASLNVGEFCHQWKTAIVGPLLKKLGLALIFPNYRPVSNLTFISKVVECCMLLQLSRHC